MGQWELASKARHDFADMMDGCSAEQLGQSTFCAKWNAHEVLAHLTGFVETSGPGLFGNLLKAGFNFDKASVAMVNKRSGRSVADLGASLRAKGAKTAPLPGFPEELTVSDVAIHTQDVRRPLGLDGELDPVVLRTALDFLTANKKARILVEGRPLDGVRLQATDMDWSFGEGAEITGSGDALMMGIANRPVLDDLSGEGLAAWS
jgi:uncharacterized protein (TIGR03083 family)